MSENQYKIKFERTDKDTWSKVVDKDSHNNSIVIVTDDNLIYTQGTHIGASKGNTLNNTIFFEDLEQVGVIETNNIEIKLLVNVNDELVYPVVVTDSVFYNENEETITLTEVIDELKENGSAVLLENIIYSDLTTLRDNSQLIPGMLYRITDYVTTTKQDNTQSANHQFDIIVMADSENTLNENARAIQCEGDTYFSNSNLSAWELKYSLDNDTTCFGWADTENGKGVIYYMKDEFENEAPYDFKNIKFRGKKYSKSITLSVVQNILWGDVNGVQMWKDMIVDDNNFYYTFSKFVTSDNTISDISLTFNCRDNKIGNYTRDMDMDSHSLVYNLPRVIFCCSCTNINLTNGIICYNIVDRCSGNIYIMVRDNCSVTHNMISSCSNVFISSHISNISIYNNNIMDCLQFVLNGGTITATNTWYCRGCFLYMTSDVKNNYIDGWCRKFKTYLTSMLSTHFHGYVEGVSFINGYVVGCEINPYMFNITSNCGLWNVKFIGNGNINISSTTDAKNYEFIATGTSGSPMNVNLTENQSNTGYMKKVAKKSNGKIVIYNESDLIADLD